MAIPSFDVTIKGFALASDGLTDQNVYDGLGLVTSGLIWGCPNIWYGPYNSNGATSISTTWALCAGASVVTNWTVFSTYNIENC